MTIIGVVLGALVLAGGCVYFVTGVIGTFPPIKKYQCSGKLLTS